MNEKRKSVPKRLGSALRTATGSGKLLKEININRQETNKRADELQNALLDINHNSQLILQELLQRQKNSGTIVLSEDTSISKIFSGLKIFMDPRDIAVFPHLALDGVWEHRITGAWLKTVRTTDTVIDIGANFGYYGALAAQITDPKASKVILFEPNPHLINYIDSTLSVNWLREQSIIENKAISDNKGTLTLHLLEGYIGSSSLHSAQEVNSLMGKKMVAKTKEKIKVETITLDEYCIKNSIKQVDLIKMDIEGFEERAYKGMRKIVSQSPEVTLFVEFTPGAYKNPKKLFETMLSDFGNIYQIEDDGHMTKITSPVYESLAGDSNDWVMFVFSKRPDIATR